MGWTKICEDDGTEVGVTGDSVWDLCDIFVIDLTNMYISEVGRKINKEEIRELLYDLTDRFKTYQDEIGVHE